jgi:hypothetical protein
MEMKDGYYWAQFKGDSDGWEVVQLCAGDVHRTGCELYFQTAEFFFGAFIEPPHTPQRNGTESVLSHQPQAKRPQET